MKNVIYQIVNLVNGKRYIGSAKSFNTRKQWHYSSLKRNNHFNQHLQNAYNKYGENSFVFEVVDAVPYAIELEERENYWISQYEFDTELYNKCPVAGSPLGVKRSQETKDKLSRAKLGEKNPNWKKSPSQKTRNRMSENRTGNKNHFYGKKHSQKTKDKISKNHPSRKSVAQIDKDTGEVIRVFESLSKAAKHVKTSHSNIRVACIKKARTCKGYRWKFI